MKRVLSAFLLVAFVLTMSVSGATFTVKRDGSATDIVTFAREVDGPYTMPAGRLTAEYAASVIRSANKNFFLTFTFMNGAKFADGSPEPWLEYAGPGGSVSISALTSMPLKDKTSFEWHIIVNAAPTSYPTFIIHFEDGAGVKIDTGTTVKNGGSISAQVAVRDASTGEPFDTPTQDVLFQGNYAISLREVVADNAIIDVATGRKTFVSEPPASVFGPTNDAVNRDAGASIDITWDPAVFAADGTIFCSNTGPDKMFANGGTQNLKIIYRSNLAEISVIRINEGTAWEVSRTLTELERLNSSVSVEGTWGQLYDGNYFQIYTQNDGGIISSRDLTISVELLSGGVVTNGRVLGPDSVLTRWRPNGTVLTMPWTNGNSSAMNGRVYLYNNTSITGSITARVVTLPRVGTPSVELGSVVVGNLPANGTAMIKVAEDILAAMPVGAPYVTDGGNLMIEFTIQVIDASGVFQVFNSGFSYGTTPLQRVN